MIYTVTLNPAIDRVLAGSLPPGVAATAYASFVSALNKRGVMCCVDASGDALRAAISHETHGVKPNVTICSGDQNIFGGA